MQRLDPRLNAYRADLADIQLQGKVIAKHFVVGQKKTINKSVVKLCKTQDLQSERQTECLCGEQLMVFETLNGVSWVQSLKDGYVGYLETTALCDIKLPATHYVCAPRTFQYLQADLRGNFDEVLSLGSKVHVVEMVETRATLYSILDNGKAIISQHLKPIDTYITDYVSVAESLINTPYLWGGASGFGIDCSGLVQLAQAMAGRAVLRDTDMQQATIGRELLEDETLQRGDLVFWKGHVAIMVDDKNIIHANGASMDVKIEVLQSAIERIAQLYQYPTMKRRP